MPVPTVNPWAPKTFIPSPPANLPANFPPELIPQFQGGRVPRCGFARMPSYGGRETGGQYVTPGSAAWNAVKWAAPLGPAYATPPATGSWQTDPDLQFLKRIPLVGRPLAAASYARREPVQWNPPMGGMEQAGEVFKNILGYVGLASPPAAWASRAIDVGEGVRKFFRPSQAFQDRTGVYGRMMTEPYDPASGIGTWSAPPRGMWAIPPGQQEPYEGPVSGREAPSPWWEATPALSPTFESVPSSSDFGGTWAAPEAFHQRGRGWDVQAP